MPSGRCQYLAGSCAHCARFGYAFCDTDERPSEAQQITIALLLAQQARKAAIAARGTSAYSTLNARAYRAKRTLEALARCDFDYNRSTGTLEPRS